MKNIKVTYMDGRLEVYPMGKDGTATFANGMCYVYAVKEYDNPTTGKLYTPLSEVPIVYIPIHNIRKLEVIEGQ